MVAMVEVIGVVEVDVSRDRGEDCEKGGQIIQ